MKATCRYQFEYLVLKALAEILRIQVTSKPSNTVRYLVDELEDFAENKQVYPDISQ